MIVVISTPINEKINPKIATKNILSPNNVGLNIDKTTKDRMLKIE